MDPESKTRSDGQGTQSLTTTQKAVMVIWAEPFTTRKDIQERLCMSEGTARFHLAEIYRRLGVSSRREAVALFNLIYASRVLAPAC
jgi:DNA-binding CsgD family transcriptional regulator